MVSDALALVVSALADDIPEGALGGQVPVLLRVAAALAEGGHDRGRGQRCRRRSPVYRSPRAHAHTYRQPYRSPLQAGPGDQISLRRRQRQQERLSRRQQRQLQQVRPAVPAPRTPMVLGTPPALPGPLSAAQQPPLPPSPPLLHSAPPQQQPHPPSYLPRPPSVVLPAVSRSTDPLPVPSPAPVPANRGAGVPAVPAPVPPPHPDVRWSH
ncbi:unnamed protein product [Closterium sp. NIES-53]